MSDLHYDPDTRDTRLREAYDESDEFPIKAWDWLTSLALPPGWLIGLLEYHYQGTAQYETDVDDWADTMSDPT